VQNIRDRKEESSDSIKMIFFGTRATLIKIAVSISMHETNQEQRNCVDEI
jgi:hypothetical protein